MKTIDTKTIELGQVKGIFMTADGKQVYALQPKPGAKVTVKIEATQVRG